MQVNEETKGLASILMTDVLGDKVVKTIKVDSFVIHEWGCCRIIKVKRLKNMMR